MTISRKVLLVSLSALMVCAMFIDVADAKYIDVSAITGNKSPCKDGSTSKECPHEKPANEYRRGCNAITRCRTERKLLGIY